MPPQREKHLHSKGVMSVKKDTRLYILAKDIENNGRKAQKKKPPMWPAPKSSNFGILGHYTQATVLINGRKSINPTILSIQIRNKLQIWPTKKIKWDNE